jgi:hypothetical protein
LKPKYKDLEPEMMISVVTDSGSHYLFDLEEMTWVRTNKEQPILFFDNLGEDPTISSGTLVEEPVIIMGRQIRFDDKRIGQIVTTRVMSAEILVDDPE